MAKPLPLPVWDRQAGKLVQEFMDDHPSTYESHPQRSLTQWFESRNPSTIGFSLHTRTQVAARGRSSRSSASTRSTCRSSSPSRTAPMPSSSIASSSPALAPSPPPPGKWAHSLKRVTSPGSDSIRSSSFPSREAHCARRTFWARLSERDHTSAVPFFSHVWRQWTIITFTIPTTAPRLSIIGWVAASGR